MTGHGVEHAVTTARASYERARALPAPDEHEVFQARRQANLDDDAARTARYRAGNATLANTTVTRASRDHRDRSGSRERQSRRRRRSRQPARQ